VTNFAQEIHALLPEIMSSPRLFVHSLDGQKASALVMEVNRDFFRRVISLNEAAANADARSARVPLDVLWRHMDAAGITAMAPAHFIFHTGSCGAALISQLLDNAPSVLGLREPQLLASMATRLGAAGIRSSEPVVEMFKRAYQLLVRRFSPTEQIVIVPASMCNNLAAILLAQNPANRGLLLFVKLERYLAGMLERNDLSSIDRFLAHRAASLARIVPDLDVETSALSTAEKLAFSWFTEAAQLFTLSTRGLAPRVLLMDFDRCLAEPDRYLRHIFSHFSVSAGDEVVAGILASPAFGPHSRQPESVRPPAMPGGDRCNPGSANAPAIRDGLKFAERLIKAHPDLGEMTAVIPLA